MNANEFFQLGSCRKTSSMLGVAVAKPFQRRNKNELSSWVCFLNRGREFPLHH
jgi:hypothetical protein